MVGHWRLKYHPSPPVNNNLKIPTNNLILVRTRSQSEIKINHENRTVGTKSQIHKNAAFPLLWHFTENLELRGHFVYSILIYLKYFEYLKGNRKRSQWRKVHPEIYNSTCFFILELNFQGAIIAMAPKKAGGLHFQDAAMQYKYKYNRLRQVVGM